MRITITLILALILAIIVTIFAVQNNTPENIKFLAWEVEGSLALILMITFALGILIGLLVSTPAWFRRVRQSAELKKSVHALEKDLEAARTVTSSPSLEKSEQPPSLEVAHTDQTEEEVAQDASHAAEEANNAG
jgi:putative membrane protein